MTHPFIAVRLSALVLGATTLSATVQANPSDEVRIVTLSTPNIVLMAQADLLTAASNNATKADAAALPVPTPDALPVNAQSDPAGPVETEDSKTIGTTQGSEVLSPALPQMAASKPVIAPTQPVFTVDNLPPALKAVLRPTDRVEPANSKSLSDAGTLQAWLIYTQYTTRRPHVIYTFGEHGQYIIDGRLYGFEDPEHIHNPPADGPTPMKNLTTEKLSLNQSAVIPLG